MKLLSKNRQNQEIEQTDSTPPIRKSGGIRRKRKPDAASGNGTKKPSRKLIVTLIVLAVIAVLGTLLMRSCAARVPGAETLYTYVQAERRDITEKLSGSGTLQPADSYTVTTLVSGDILSATFDEGEVVTKGDVLYEIDSSDASTSIERAEISLARNQRSYDDKVSSQADLTVTSPISGAVTGITVSVGDSVNANAPIATIENISVLTLTEYYSSEYSGQIYAGMPATVSIPDHMLNLTGKVKEVSSMTRTSDTGITCFAVTVEVQNPGSLSIGTASTCWLSGEAGDIYPSISDDDGLDASSRRVVYAGVSGTVANIRVRNNDTVSSGAVLMLLSSDSLSDEILSAADSLRDAELSLQSQYDTLEDYTVTAPIDGTIVDKYYKEGETSEGGKPLCIIYDLSSLTLTLNVDELDISEVSIGQAASITADAVEGKTYEGVVTRVGVNGTTTSGVTTYPVDIRIDVTDGLLPGMNVDVSIIVQESSDVLSIPAGALERSGRVLVKTSDGSTGEGAPEGYDYVYVETGISDGDYVQIISGLSENDTVAYIPETASGSDIFMFPGGEMQGGGPQGGQGGGPQGAQEGFSGGTY